MAPRKYNTELIIKLMKEIYERKYQVFLSPKNTEEFPYPEYDYSETKYTKIQNKLKITCKHHGPFWVKWNDVKHHSSGCPECGKNLQKLNSRSSLESVIEEFKKIHMNKYDYSKVKYINDNTKIEIICPEHGSFWQKPGMHKRAGNGCPDCAKALIKRQKQKILKDNSKKFIDKIKKIYKEKYKVFLTDKNYNNFPYPEYDYSETIYSGAHTKVKIICKHHGPFWVKPNQIFTEGNGCPKCARIMSGINGKLTTEEVINQFKKIHGDKYNYSKVKYKLDSNHIEIICSDHGSFFITPRQHKSGYGCPKCSGSKIEKLFRDFLDKINIDYKEQYKFFNPLTDYYQYFDFYLQEYNIAIELDGAQHYQSIDFFGGQEQFQNSKKKDFLKNKYCFINNINLIRIPYFECNENYFKNIFKREKII